MEYRSMKTVFINQYLNRRDSDVRVYVTITAAVQAESKKYTKARIEGNEDT